MLFMKKLNTKIFSFVLALLMIFGVSSTAFASEIDNPNNNVLGTYEIEVPISSSDDSILYATTELATGEVSVSQFTIPTDVEKAKVTVSNLQVYELVNGSWISGLSASKNITIN